jgi:hypothetical protein
VEILQTLLSQKTTWDGLAMIVTGISALCLGAQWLTTEQIIAIQIILNGLGMIFLRQAIKKVAKL